MDPDDTAILLFTSGTTGAPKAAVLRQKHLVSYVLGTVEFMGADENDASLTCVPPYHVAGMAAIASSVYSGRRVVQLASFSPEAATDFGRLLYLLEHTTLPFGGHVRRFSSLAVADRAELLAGWATSGHDLLRAGLRGLVATVFLAYYRDASAFAAVRYPGPLLPGGGGGGGYARLVAPAGATP